MENQLQNHQDQIQNLSNEVRHVRSILNNLSETILTRKSRDELLQNCVSLLKSTIDATLEGILVVDTFGKIAAFNKKFTELWKIPDSLIDTLDDDSLLAFVVDQVKDPESFLAKVRDLYREQSKESFDILEFKNGKTIERYSRPQRMEGKIIGRVWCFRDVTERVKLEILLSNLTSKHAYLSLATKSLVSSADFDELLKSIRRILIPRISDAYSIDIIDDDHHIQCIDFNYPDVSLSEFGKELRQKFPFDLLAPTGIPKVFRSGKSEIYIETSDLILHEVFPNSSFNTVLEKIKIYSIMLVPLVIRGKVFGVVTLMSSNVDRHFTWDDLRLSEEVCMQIAIAIDNSLINSKKMNFPSITLPKLNLGKMIHHWTGKIFSHAEHD